MNIDGRTNTRRVWVDGRELSPTRSQSLRLHSHDGFAWGYSGSGPAQLALAILLQAGVPEDIAMTRYQDFKREIIAALPMDQNFEINIQIGVDGSWVKT